MNYRCNTRLGLVDGWFLLVTVEPTLIRRDSQGEYVRAGGAVGISCLYLFP